MIVLSFSGIWNIPGIFQKNTTTSKIFHFWNMEYSGIFQRKGITTKSATKIIHFLLSIILFLTFSGIWNIPKFCPNKKLFQILEYGIFQKNGNMKNIEIGGIWNIRGIFPKNSKTIKISRNIQWNIPRIFQKL